MVEKSRLGEQFFLIMGLVLTAIVVGGFIPSVFSRPGSVGRNDYS